MQVWEGLTGCWEKNEEEAEEEFWQKVQREQKERWWGVAWRQVTASVIRNEKEQVKWLRVEVRGTDVSTVQNKAEIFTTSRASFWRLVKHGDTTGWIRKANYVQHDECEIHWQQQQRKNKQTRENFTISCLKLLILSHKLSQKADLWSSPSNTSPPSAASRIQIRRLSGVFLPILFSSSFKSGKESPKTSSAMSWSLAALEGDSVRKTLPRLSPSTPRNSEKRESTHL